MKIRNVKLLALLMTAALTATTMSACRGGEQPSAKPEPEIEKDETVTISKELIKEYGETSSTVWEFLQRFFSDEIVYRDKDGEYAYVPVNKDLPQSSYDWDNLVKRDESKKDLEYVVDGETVSIKGIDVSRYQKDIDWKKVAADGVDYAFIRLGYRGYDKGGIVKDDMFDENVTGAIKNDVGVGVYFVTQAISVEEAIEEAEYVLDNIKAYNITWPIVMDIEDAASADARTAKLTQEERTDNVIAFCETIKEAGYTPMLYCNIRWYIEELDITRIADYQKWFAQYFNRPFFPYEFQIWQYTSSGTVDGISGNVDLNMSFVDYANGSEGDGDRIE